MYSPNKTIKTIGIIGALILSSTVARAVDPPPDGGYPNENTAEGDSALFSLTTGAGNTGVGFQALFSNTTGIQNTANGSDTLQLNTIGSFNTAIGASALQGNTTGDDNTATGYTALFSNTTGIANTAVGFETLFNNTIGSGNTANGDQSLYSNTSGGFNTASGDLALRFNTTGTDNTASGFEALYSNTTGSNNTANGTNTLSFNTTGVDNTANGGKALIHNTSGSSNIALGSSAGINLTTGSNNIDIGNAGVAGEAGILRIGTNGTQTATFIAGIKTTPISGVAVGITADGQLGVRASSARFKTEIKSMGKASEAILALKPVTFYYKKDVDPKGISQFGLVAEDVAKVAPDLVTCDAEGKPFTVRYDEVNAMLLNEFLKEHRKVEEQAHTNQAQDATITDLKSRVAQQQNDIVVLTAALKAQAAVIQKVSDQVRTRSPAPRLVTND